MAFATGMQARLPLGPLTRGFLTTPQASLDAADWPVAPRPASTPGSRPTPGAALPGTLASPRTGLTPAGYRELVARLRRGALLSVLLGARATGRTFPRNHPGSPAGRKPGRYARARRWSPTIEERLPWRSPTRSARQPQTTFPSSAPRSARRSSTTPDRGGSLPLTHEGGGAYQLRSAGGGAD